MNSFTQAVTAIGYATARDMPFAESVVITVGVAQMPGCVCWDP